MMSVHSTVRNTACMLKCGLCFALAVVALPAATISVSPFSTSVVAGRNFDVRVVVDSISDLYAYQFDIAFDPSIVRATGVSAGALLGNAGATLFVPGDIDNTVGIIAAIANSLQGSLGGVTGTGELAIIEFEALKPGTTQLTLFNSLLLDSQLLLIDGGVIGGNATVLAPEPSVVLMTVLGLALGIAFKKR